MAYFEKANSVDADGNIINPAQDEQIILLRRIAKVLESTAAADVAQRQRITLDAITSGLTLATVTSVGNIGTVSSLDQRQFIDVARNAYANGIRSKLTFS